MQSYDLTGEQSNFPVFRQVLTASLHAYGPGVLVGIAVTFREVSVTPTASRAPSPSTSTSTPPAPPSSTLPPGPLAAPPAPDPTHQSAPSPNPAPSPHTTPSPAVSTFPARDSMERFEMDDGGGEPNSLWAKIRAFCHKISMNICCFNSDEPR